ALERQRRDHVQRVVEQHLLAAAEVVDVHRRGDRYPHLAPGGEDVHGLVVVPAQEDPVAARRLRQAVDLLLQGDDLRPRLLERGDQPLVVFREAGQLRGRGGEPLLQLTHVSGALADLPARQCQLLLQERDLRGEIVGFPLPPCGARIRIVAACHGPTSPGGHNVLSSTLARACPVRRPWTHLSSNLDLCEMRHSRLPETPPPAVGTVEETSAGGAPAAPPPGKEYAWARG